MNPAECRNHVRYSLSDENGLLRFRAFDITDEPDCGDAINRLREYLLGRPLKDIKVDELSGLASDEACARLDEVIKAVRECQDMFVRSREDR
jgi:hypothetical protein